MIYKEYKWKSKDGINLYAQAWKPDEQTDAAICYVHGFGSHSGRYRNFAQKFTQYNIGVLAIDYRGHGKSNGKRGYIKKYDELLFDVEVLIKNAKKVFPKTPIFLYGHSMGGNIVLNLLLKNNISLKGAIASSPWIKLSYRPKRTKVVLSVIISKLIPKFVKKLKLNPDILTKDENAKQAYLNDPLVHSYMSPKLYLNSVKAGKNIISNKHKINIPLLLMHGNKDKLTSCNATKSIAKNTSQTTQLKIWNNYYHELHNEKNNEPVFQFVLDWIKNQIYMKRP
jgi:alpha-beta hydrolase superfamily lysophospholipase